MDEEEWISIDSYNDKLVVVTNKQRYEIGEISIPTYYLRSIADCFIREFNEDETLYEKLRKSGVLLPKGKINWDNICSCELHEDELDLIGGYDTVKNLEDSIWKTPQFRLTVSAATLSSLLVDFDHVFVVCGFRYKSMSDEVEKAIKYSCKIKRLIRNELGIPDNVEIAHLNLND